MTSRFPNSLKITAFITLLIFSAQSLLQSAPAIEPSLKSKEAISAPSFLKSPKSYFSVDRGQVQEQFLSQSTPFIYLVEDAHDSLDAQESIRQILKQLVEKEKVSLVCFEGGSEKLDRSFYDFTRDSSKNKQIWDELFKQGQIGGLERYALEASSKVKFSGLENKKVYFENVHSVQRIFREKEKLQGVLKQIDSIFEELSGKLVAGDAKKIRDLRKSFNDGRLNLIQYAKELIKNGNRNQSIVSAQVEWPQMARLIKLQEFELKLKQQEAGIQKELAQVRKKTSSDLRFIWFPEQHEKVKGHLRWYFEKAVDQGLNLKKYPNLSNWVGFHVLQDEISAGDLFEELGQLEADVLSKLEVPEETRTFLKLDHDYVRVKKLISLEVSRKEWNQLKSDNLNLKPLAKQLCALYKRTFHRKPKIKVWDALRLIALFKSAKSNYELVEMRDSILSKRIKEQVALARVKKAAVVTGGFHTDMIAAFLKAQQIGYAVISPVISDVNNKLNYRALIDPKLSKTRQPEVSSFGTDAAIIPYQNSLKQKAFAIGKSLGKGEIRDFATLKAPTADPLQNRINSDFVFIESVIKKAKEVEIPENLLSELRSPKHGKIFERLIQAIRLRKSPRIRFYVSDDPAAANLFGIPRYNGAILARDTIPAYSNRDNRGDLRIYVTRHFYQLMLKDYSLYAFVLDHEFYEKFTVPNKSHEQAWRDRGWLDYFVDSNTKLNKYLKIFIDRMAEEGDVEGLDRFKNSNTEKGRLSYEYAQMKKRDVLSRSQLFLTIKPEVDDKEIDAWRVNKAIANRGINLEVQYAKFENEERYAYVPDPDYVKGKDCTLFFNKPDSNRELIKLLFAVELLEDCGAKSITLILPANTPVWLQDSLRAFATIHLVNTKQAKNKKKHDHLPLHGEPIPTEKKRVRPPAAREFDRILIMPNADKYEWRGMHNLAYLQMNEANGRMQIPQGLKSGGHYLLIAMTDRHNEVLRLLETLSALARKGIHPVVFVPYFSYGRQHMAYPMPKHGPKAVSSNSARAILKAVSQFSSRVYGVNMHFTKHPGEMDVEKEFPGLGQYIQIHNVNLFPQLVQYFQKNEKLIRPVIVGADKGAHEFALEASKISGIEYGKHMDKVRDGSKPTQMQVDMKMPETDVTGRDVILLDDIIASGTTIINAALLLKSRGAKRVFVGTVYGEFTKGIEIFQNKVVIKKQIENLNASGQLTAAQFETLNALLSGTPLIDGLKATDIMLALNPENVVSLTSILDLNKLMMNSPARRSIYDASGASLGKKIIPNSLVMLINPGSTAVGEVGEAIPKGVYQLRLRNGIYFLRTMDRDVNPKEYSVNPNQTQIVTPGATVTLEKPVRSRDGYLMSAGDYELVFSGYQPLLRALDEDQKIRFETKEQVKQLIDSGIFYPKRPFESYVSYFEGKPLIERAYLDIWSEIKEHHESETGSNRVKTKFPINLSQVELSLKEIKPIDSKYHELVSSLEGALDVKPERKFPVPNPEHIRFVPGVLVWLTKQVHVKYPTEDDLEPGLYPLTQDAEGKWQIQFYQHGYPLTEELKKHLAPVKNLEAEAISALRPGDGWKFHLEFNIDPRDKEGWGAVIQEFEELEKLGVIYGYKTGPPIFTVYVGHGALIRKLAVWVEKNWGPLLKSAGRLDTDIFISGTRILGRFAVDAPGVLHYGRFGLPVLLSDAHKEGEKILWELQSPTRQRRGHPFEGKEERVLKLVDNATEVLKMRYGRFFSDGLEGAIRPDVKWLSIGKDHFSEGASLGQPTAEDIQGKMAALFEQAGLDHRSDFMTTDVGIHLGTQPDITDLMDAMNIKHNLNASILDLGHGQGELAIRMTAHMNLLFPGNQVKIHGIEFDGGLYQESLKLLKVAEDSGFIPKGQVQFFRGDFNDPSFNLLFKDTDVIFYASLSTRDTKRLGHTLSQNLTKRGARIVEHGSRKDLEDAFLSIGIPHSKMTNWENMRVYQLKSAGASLGVVQMRQDVIEYFASQEASSFSEDQVMALVKYENEPKVAAALVKYRFMPPAKNRKTFVELALMLNKDAKHLRSMEEIILLILWRKIKREELDALKNEGKQKEILARPLTHLNLPGQTEGRLIRVGFGRFGSENITVGDVLKILIERRARYTTPDAIPASEEENTLEELGFSIEAVFRKIPVPELVEMIERLRGMSEKYDRLVSLIERGQEAEFFSSPVSDLDLDVKVLRRLKKAGMMFYKQDQEMTIEQLMGLAINELLKVQASKKDRRMYLAELEYKLYQLGYRLGQMHGERMKNQPKFTMNIGKVIRLSDLKKKDGVEAVLKQPITALDLPEKAFVILKMFTKTLFQIDEPVIGDLKNFSADQAVGLKTALQEQNFKSLNSQLENLADFSIGNSLGNREKNELRNYLEGIEKEKRAELFRDFIASDPGNHIDIERTLAILENRIASNQETAQQIADRFRVTRARIGQIEARLVQKLWRYLQTGNSPDYDKKNETLTRLFAEGRKAEMLERSISELGLTPRVESALIKIAEERSGSRNMTIGQLIEYTAESLLLKKNFGYESLQDVESRLEKFGLTFSDGRDLDAKRRFEELERSMIEERREAVLASSIRVLGLNTRSMNVLARIARVELGQDDMRIGQLAEFTEKKLLSERGMGVGSIQDIKSRLAKLGLKLAEGKSLGNTDNVSLNAVIIVRDASGGIVGLYLREADPEIYQSLIPRFASDKPTGQSLVITGPVSPIALIDQIKGHKTVIVYYEDEAYKNEFDRVAEKMKEKGEVIQEELNRYGYFAYLPKLHLTRAEFVRQVLKNVKVDYDGVGPRSIGRIASESGIRNYVNRLVWQGDEDLIHQVITKMPVVLGRPLRVTKGGSADADLVVLKLAALLSENPEALEKKGLLVLENGIYVPTDLFYSFLDKAIAEHNFEKLTATMA